LSQSRDFLVPLLFAGALAVVEPDEKKLLVFLSTLSYSSHPQFSTFSFGSLVLFGVFDLMK